MPGDDDGTAPAIDLVSEGGGVYTYTVMMTSQGDEMGLEPRTRR